MVMPRRLTGFSLAVAGIPKEGLLTELMLPVIAMKNEEFRAAGSDIPIPVEVGGMEMLKAEFTMAEYDPQLISLFGWVQGGPIQFEARGVQKLFNNYSVIVTKMEGVIQRLDFGTWSAGDTGMSLKVSADLFYYSLDMDGSNLIEIDGVNGKRVIGGQDQRQIVRILLGLV
jgi:P2 family phage contractile tail tube protein